MKVEIKEISNKTIFGPCKVEELIISSYYDLHGMIIPDNEVTTIKDKTIQINHHKYKHEYLGTCEDYELFIDGERYHEIEITSIKGTAKKLLINGCSGAG